MAAQTSPAQGKLLSISPALDRAIDHILTASAPPDAPEWARVVMSGSANELQALRDGTRSTTIYRVERCVLRWFLADLAARNEPEPKETAAARVYRCMPEVRP